MANILILEDNPETAFQLASMLETAGHDTIWCRDAAEAFAAYDRDSCDLIIADVFVRKGRKSEPEGLTFIGKTAILEKNAPNKTPIIAISGVGHKEYNPYVLANARSFGAQFTLEKPITESTLFETVAQALRLDET